MKKSDAILMSLLIALVIGVASVGITQQYYRKNAVKHGCAKWVVDENGVVDFVWLQKFEVAGLNK